MTFWPTPLPWPGGYFGIPDIGFCAGLKLIAPPHLTTIYQQIAARLRPELTTFLENQGLTAEFKQLELLSSTRQMVFAPDNLVPQQQLPRGTACVGPLPINLPTLNDTQTQKPIILCFGSALDPADYPLLVTHTVAASAAASKQLIIISRKLRTAPAANVSVTPYLPLTAAMQHAAILIHHGGANTFAESLALGVPQILIPLTTDQPVQAESLRKMQAGVVLYPNEVNFNSLSAGIAQLLDSPHPVHKHIQQFKKIYAAGAGAKNAVRLIESISCSC